MKAVVATGLAAGLAVAACGGGGGGGSSPVAVVPGPQPTPTAAAPPTPAPGPSYTAYTALTGDQRFGTGCGAVRSDGFPYAPRPAPTFGEGGLTLDYAAATQTYRVSASGNPYILGTPRSFGPAERDATAIAPVVSYARTVNNFQERLSIGYPAALGTVPTYVRGFSLRTPEGDDYRPGAVLLQYSCVFGVPTLPGDLPATGDYARVAFNGAGYVTRPGVTLETYALAGSTVAVRVDRAAGTVTTTLRLSGLLQSAGGPATTPTDLGSYAITTPIDARGGFSGQADANEPDRSSSVFASGAFFGPQGVEAAMGLALYAADASGRRISAVGNVVAQR